MTSLGLTTTVVVGAAGIFLLPDASGGCWVAGVDWSMAVVVLLVGPVVVDTLLVVVAEVLVNCPWLDD